MTTTTTKTKAAGGARVFGLVLVAGLAWLAILAQGFDLTRTTTTTTTTSHRYSPSHSGHRPFSISRSRLEAARNANATPNHGIEIEIDAIRVSRRSAVATLAATACASLLPREATAAKGPNGLTLETAPNSGLRWVDAKVGSGEAASLGSTTSIDYSMASTAGRFPSIYSTKNGDEPYRWKLGDGSTIKGIELAILGDPSEGIPPMKSGGIRRVIVPNALGYNALINRDGDNNAILNKNKNNANSNANLAPSAKNQRCLAGSEGSLGPIPPKEAPDGAYQRWYQFYCNPRIPYQPDLVLDIKLYGKRPLGSATATATATATPTAEVAASVAAPSPEPTLE